MSYLIGFLLCDICCHGCYYSEGEGSPEIETELSYINDEDLDTDPETDSTGSHSSDDRFLECYPVPD